MDDNGIFVYPNGADIFWLPFLYIDFIGTYVPFTSLVLEVFNLF
jgi:hypothetical protein